MNESVWRYLRHTAWPIVVAMVLLMVVGVSAIHVAEQADATLREYAARQIVYVAVGLATFFAVLFIPYRQVGRAAYPLFALTLVLLVVVLLLPEIRGSHRWIDLGFVQAQPSEFAKIAFIVLLAWYLRRGDHYRRLRGLVVPFVLTFVPMGLILIEPDLGTALLFLPTLYVMLFMAGAKLRHLLGIVAVATALVLVPVPTRLDGGGRMSRSRRNLAYWTFERDGQSWALLAAPLSRMKYHQITRIEGWLRQGDPSLRMGAGYHLHQSKSVLGAGRLTGRGDWNTSGTYFRIVPDDHTDFIFSVIGGQWGFAGAIAVLLLYAVIFLFGLEIAAATHDAFGRLLAVGVLALLFSQILINVGMTMGLMPITGMTLPLVSYGGSSLVVNCAALGLLVNVGQRRPILLSRRPFEHGEKRQRVHGPEGPLRDLSDRDDGRKRDEGAKVYSQVGSS